MGGVERFLKDSNLAALRIVGEILFGTKGEEWEEIRREQNG